MSSLTLLSPAKINLGLRILSKRPDGYHDINSICMSIDLYDELSFDLADGVHVVCTPPMTKTVEENLVYKAASRLHALTGTTRGAKIDLSKRIPSGAGLGGGSSNAATTLIGLNNLWNQHLSIQELSEIGASLGADVPFFLHGNLAYVQGTGTSVTPLHHHIPWYIVVATPDIHSSTAEAYNNVALHSDRADLLPLPDLLSYVLDNKPTSSDEFNELVKENLVNDFSSYLVERYPVIGSICKTLLERQALFASVSGSGSSVFGLFTSVDNANQAASALAPYRSYICRPTNPGMPV